MPLLKEIQKIPTRFDGYYPLRVPGDPPEELGNYDWYLYQYQVDGTLDMNSLKSDEEFRNKLPPFGTFSSSKIISYESFLDFLIMNYQGWAPYGRGMEQGKARSLAENLLNSFLSCGKNEAVYIEYARSSKFRMGCDVTINRVETPAFISGVMGILDSINKEFFVLIMGGVD